MNQHPPAGDVFDEFYRHLLGRAPNPGESLSEWRRIGARLVRDIAIETRARRVISVAQHMAHEAEIETARVIERMQISSKP